MRNHSRRVENYTTAFLVTSGVILFMVFFTLAATKGFTWVLLSAAIIDGFVRFTAARLDVRAG